MEKKIKAASLMDVMEHLLAHADLSANGLAKILNLPTPTIHRLATGEVQDPRSSTMIFIADYFGITIDQLLGREELDSRFQSKNCAKTIKPASSIPMLSMHEALTASKYHKSPSQWFRWQSNHSIEKEKREKIFSICIKNNLYEPLFYQNSIIIIDPTLSAENGDYVLVSFKGDNVSVLKRYLSEGKNKYLSAVNADNNIMKFDPKESEMIGIVIESCRHFRVDR